ncbi:mechanosensitive ion channel, partial [bacterium]|nr:mechanosensitive ion channel [bacterium]
RFAVVVLMVLIFPTVPGAFAQDTPSPAPAASPAPTAVPATPAPAAAPAAPTPVPTPLPDATLEDVEASWREMIAQVPSPIPASTLDSQLAKNDEEKLRLMVVDLRNLASLTREWRVYREQQIPPVERLVSLYRKEAEALGDKRANQRKKEQYARRVEALSHYMELMRERLTNLDQYLQALDLALEAHETRLQQIVSAGATQAAQNAEANVAADDAAAGSIPKFFTNDGTRDEFSTYERHKRILDDLQRQLENQIAAQKEAEAKVDLYGELIKAARMKLATQSADAKLTQREETVTEELSAAYRGESTWSGLWRDRLKQVAARREELRKEIGEQNRLINQYAGDRSYAEAVSELKKQRASEIEQAIAKERTRLPDVLLRTAWDLVLSKGLILIAIVLLGWLIGRIIRFIGNVLIRRSERNTAVSGPESEQRTRTLVTVFSGVLRGLVFFVLGLLFLDALGVNITPLMGAFAILGLAVSFGSQNLVKDIVNGFFILAENQLSVGDVVKTGGVAGLVESISLRRLVLRDLEGTVHSIPNSQITVVSNLTHNWARTILDIGVAYKSDLVKVRGILNRIGEEIYKEPDWKIKMYEAPSVMGVESLADSSIVFRVWVKVKPGAQWDVKRELNLRIKQAFDKEGIEIPFPQRTVWTVGASNLDPNSALLKAAAEAGADDD